MGGAEGEDVRWKGVRGEGGEWCEVVGKEEPHRSMDSLCG